MQLYEARASCKTNTDKRLVPESTASFYCKCTIPLVKDCLTIVLLCHKILTTACQHVWISIYNVSKVSS